MLKINKQLAKSFRCAYLNPEDKSLVVWHSEKDKRGVETEWASLHQLTLSVGLRGLPEGLTITRLGIDTLYLLRLVVQAPRIELWWNNSTRAAEDKGFRIEGLKLYGPLSGGAWGDHLCLNSIPGLITGEFFFNTDVEHKRTTYEALAASRRWGGHTLLMEE